MPDAKWSFLTDANNGEIYAAEVGYDPYNNLASFKERIAGEGVCETAYEYDAENKPTKVTYSNGLEVQYLYDGLGRVTKRSVIHGTDSQETSYTYVHGAGDNTTPLICRITQLGERMLYTYDEVGNILSVEYPDRQPETIPTTLTLRTEDNEPIYSSETAEVFFASPSCRFLQNKNAGFCTYKM
ncbi:MAG: RHS repeat protein [Firmicutes bacterium]|nr:RHS repeat protein [Bacillota bacterium]